MDSARPDQDAILFATERPYHINIVYRSDGFLMSSVGSFIQSNLARGGAAIAIATRPHLDALKGELAGCGLDLIDLESTQRYFTLDVDEVYERVTANRSFDEAGFLSIARDVLDRARWDSRSVGVYGEIVGLLAEQGDFEGAARVEGLWATLLEERPHAALCGYPGRAIHGETQRRRLGELCDLHQHTVSTGI